jgi:hypothetical protein
MTVQNAASGQALGRLARDDVPFLFDTVAVKPDGSFEHKARQALNFSFDYHGATFGAMCRRVDGRFVVSIGANLGPLPFSAESVRARREIQDLIATSLDEPRLTLAEDQTIHVESEFELAQPASPVVMLTAVTELLLALKPTLERLSEIMTGAGSTAQGTA